MTGGILQSAAGFPLYQRNSIPRRTGASTPSMRQGFSQARSPVQVKASAPNPSSNRRRAVPQGGTPETGAPVCPVCPRCPAEKSAPAV